MFGYDTELFSTFLIFLIVLYLTYWFIDRKRKHASLPPGPTPFPLLGNIPQLAGKDLRRTLQNYRKKYGNLFTLYVFNRILIVVNGYEDIKDAFVKNGVAFSGRPVMSTRFFKGTGVLMASGEIWKQNRRFTIHTLRDFGMGKNKLQSRIHEEISYFLDAIQEHHGQPFDIKDLLNIAVSNVICSIVFGNRFDYRDKTFLNYLHNLDELIRSSTLVKPAWVKYIPGDPFHAAKQLHAVEKLREFYTTKVREHLETFDEDNIRDLIDVYIKQMKNSNTSDRESFMNEDNLVRIVHDLYLAGTESSTTALRSGLVYLLRNPEIQQRLFTELHEVVPGHRFPDLNDKKNLSFVEATVLEILRRGCIAPFGAPHSVTNDLEYRGYTIPSTALVMANLETVLMDEKLWDDPQSFKPSRFLDENMSLKIIDEFIPFSLGPRVCLGENMAKMEIYLFLSAMLQRFKFVPPEGVDPASFEFVYGHMCAPKAFKLRAIKI